ncbi:MAG: selenocysteine-specific translation elongation factor [Terriglobales bacterium]|jgi:selenocysteine-specific elongation factor
MLMKSVIVGTAGHIDHGKTALVKALTGTDTDRLAEEKRRGVTIDIGFAHLELPAQSPVSASQSGTGGVRPAENCQVPTENFQIGFVDVPGHERFVRNMLAGVGGIDMVVLVIAADESIKPQTREHFDICRLLNVQRGLTVLTKSDLVDSDTLEVVRLEVEDFLRGSFLEQAPILAVSSLTGQGLGQLRSELARIATTVADRGANALFRLPIDRVFSMKGFGTVVTGTLISGTVRKEEEVEVFPTGRRVRVRGIQVHNAPAAEALAGQRTALNVAGASTEDLARGMTLVPPGQLRTTKRADVQITLLPGVRPLRDRSRVHFHCYTAETIAQVVLLQPSVESSSGTETGNGLLAAEVCFFAQLRFREPQLLLPGDRFILRQFSPVVTMGGGVVVDAVPMRLRRRGAASHISQLRTLAAGSTAELLMARVRRRGEEGLTLADAIAETGWTHAQLQQAVGAAGTSMVRVEDLLVASDAFTSSRERMAATVADFHNGHPLVGGISREELREKLGLRLEVFQGVLSALIGATKLQVAGEQVHTAGRGVVMKDEEAESKLSIEAAFASAGLKVPALKDVIASLKVDRVRAQKIVTLLLRERTLVKVSDDLVFHRGALEQLRRLIADQKQVTPRIDVARFKDLTGITRKYAIPLLEYLDREHVTRRVGDERIIL